MKLAHIERFNKSAAMFRDDCNRFIIELESEMKRAKAIRDTAAIAAELVIEVPELSERAEAKQADGRVDRLRRTDRPQPLTAKLVEINKTDMERLEREISQSVEDVLSAS